MNSGGQLKVGGIERGNNALGIAGFVISIVGLCSGGVISPIGLVMSLVALRNQPRGFAIAGTVIGAVGSCGILVALVVVPVALVAVLVTVLVAAGAAGAAAALAGSAGPSIETQVETAFLAINLEEYHKQHGSYPQTLDEGLANLKTDSGLRKDHWDRAYGYEAAPDGSKYWLFSVGEDGVAGTADDMMSKVSVEKFGPRAAAGAPSVPGTAPAPPADLPAEEGKDREGPGEGSASESASPS